MHPMLTDPALAHLPIIAYADMGEPQFQFAMEPVLSNGPVPADYHPSMDKFWDDWFSVSPVLADEWFLARMRMRVNGACYREPIRPLRGPVVSTLTSDVPCFAGW